MDRSEIADFARVYRAFLELLELSGRHDQYGAGPVDCAHVAVSPDDELACVDFGVLPGRRGS